MPLFGVLTLRMIVSVVIGGILGYGYYRLVGCRSGVCPISGNPYISTLYGAFLGFMFASK